jgi:hypothetical protein
MAQDYDFWDAAAQCLDTLEQAEEMSDITSAAEGAQLLANIHSERANILALHRQHANSKVPYMPPALSNEEKLAKPYDKCTWGDAYEWASKSKHGVDNAAFERGIQEVMRRRQSGE